MSSADPTGPPANATLLIVDDDTSVCARLRVLFEAHGYSVITACGAPEALKLAKQNSFQLIMLDVEMPDIDGISLCRLLRAQTNTEQIPVLALTATDNESRMSEAFDAGVDDYIIKPWSDRELLAKVRVQVEAWRRTQELVGSNRELLFLSDLGRNLLRALEPEQVVRTVAAAAYDGTDAAVCAVAVNPSRSDEAICVFDREGSVEQKHELYLDRLVKWIRSDDSTSSQVLHHPEEFLLRDAHHIVEYVAPLRFGRRTQGALIVGYDRVADCSDAMRRLVDAAAQQTAMAAHIASLYDAARDASISLAKEEQRQFMESIIDTLPVSIYAIDREFRIVAWNRNREIGGQGIPRDSALGRNIFEVLTKQPRDVLEREFARAFATGSIERFEQESLDENGEAQYWLISKIPMRDRETFEITHVITVGENITSRVKANRAVARAEKLAAVGRLAAGVVHEINNPLATISACAEALESRVAEGIFGQSPELNDLQEYLGLIRSEAFRCKSITNGLLDFSRNRAGKDTDLNVTDVLRSAARLLSHQRRSEEIDVVVETAGDYVLVSGDEGQLQQAVIALSTNAIDAMPEGGTLTLRLLQRDGRVVIEVRDTGVGIEPENLPKIFDPFFTTKEVGKGTGLGLAVCYGIVTEHGGRLDVQSTPGVGTVFAISLPALPVAVDGEPTA